MKNTQRLSTLLSLSVFLVLMGCSSNENSIRSYIGTAIPQSALDNYLEQQMEALKIPGLSIAFINNGEVVHQLVKGYADLENQTPVTEQTIFEGASISKSVFAYFVMTFVDEGKLDLDKPLYTYLPYPDISHDERYKAITARMALSHRSGFPNWREDESDKKLKLYFEPDSAYLYSGEGYQYLALVLREITQTDWSGLEALFQERVAQPLGLEHTVFIQTPYVRANKATPYDENGKLIDWRNNYWFKKSDSLFVAAATIHSEAVDFSKWMIAIMNEQGLSSQRYQEMLKHYSFIEENGIYQLYYTLGFVQPDLPFTDLYTHGGNNIGFTSWFALDKEKKWGYVLFTNSEFGEQLGTELLFYLLAGPNKTIPILIISALGLFLLLSAFFLLRWTIRKISATKQAK